MTPSTFPSRISVRTKSLLATLLAGVGAIAFAVPGAHAVQTASLNVLANFAGMVPSGEEGASSPPVSTPFEASDGNYYGIAPIGGTFGNGIVFKVTPAGVYSVLHNFHDDEFSDPLIEEGNEPRVLIQGADGNLYGICNDGGLNDDSVNFNGGGTLFKITLGGTYTKLYDFDKGDPNLAPVAPVALLQTSDGNFYGLTQLGGKASNAAGTFFRFNASTKVFTELYDFINTSTIGVEPQAQLCAGTAGVFYGVTSMAGGTDTSVQALGAIFKITTAGTPTLLHAFVPNPDNPNAVVPQGDSTPLFLGTDANLYGASTVGGDENDYGTIYKCTTAGAFTVLHVFEDEADGAYPFGGLVEGADGTFYGGLQGDFGTASQQAGGYFQIKAGGAYTLLYKFNASNATGPVQAASKLVEISKGTFYGETAGGANGIGTLAKIVVTPAVTSPATASTTVGAAFSYTITATNGPTSFGVQGLPAGTTVNATTGVISGAVKTAGTYQLTLNARNGAGVGSEVLTLTVKAPTAAPVVTSATAASGTTGHPFSYQITATNGPTSFGVQGLPAGLAVSATTGLISGAPKATGKFTLTVNAYNSIGKGSATVTLTITEGTPVITSAATATVVVNKAFSYQIAALNSPTAFGVQGLPAGLTVNSSTGLISGTPKAAAKLTLTLNCYNSVGKGSGTLTLTITAS